MPTTEVSYSIIREMYGKQLSEKSLSVYASAYKGYIRDSKLAEKHNKYTNNLSVGWTDKKNSNEELLPIDKIAEIWNLLPEEFTYKQVKALVPVHISQSAPRIDTTNFIIDQFKNHPLFDCEEPTAGAFKKVMEEKGEEDE